MREIVHVQGGQCGNQIGAKFEEDAWSKHEAWEYRWTAKVWTYTDNHKKLITIVKDNCLPKSGGSEPKVFYLKMIGDYYRYTAKAASGDKLTEVTENASKYYQQAIEAADSLNIKVDLRWTNYDFSQMNFEVLLITQTYRNFIRK